LRSVSGNRVRGMGVVSYEESTVESVQVLCLRVTAEADPGALPRLLAYFQQLNVLPRRVTAEFGSDELLHVRIDIAGVAEAPLNVLAAKMGQIPTVLSAYWHRS
jgi:hypothetical protein